MNNSIYEEYMRSVLGYQDNNTYDMNLNYTNSDMQNMNAMTNVQIKELESCYPDIYKIVYPMIKKVCTQNMYPITKDMIDNMTNEIYFEIEDKDMLENRNKQEQTEDRQINRNTNLNDLIRILIIRELLGGNYPRSRPPRPPIRPPMGPPIPRPRPGMGPFNRCTYEQYDNLYE